MNKRTLGVMLSVLAACATPEHASVAPVLELVTLDDSESQLRAAFNANSESPQLLLILSPT